MWSFAEGPHVCFPLIFYKIYHFVVGRNFKGQKPLNIKWKVY
jgi:hypothetical protein